MVEKDAMTVINFANYKKEKELESVTKDLDHIFNASDAVLDVVEEQFDEGVVIGLLDGELQISSSMDDIDSILSFLESAIQCVKENY